MRSSRGNRLRAQIRFRPEHRQRRSPFIGSANIEIEGTNSAAAVPPTGNKKGGLCASNRGLWGLNMPPQYGLGTVEQLKVLIQTVRDALTKSREVITRVDATAKTAPALSLSRPWQRAQQTRHRPHPPTFQEL